MDKGWGLALDNSGPPVGFNFLISRPSTHFPATDFPMNLNHQKSASSPADENRMVLSEVDFFSNNSKIKKENSHVEASTSVNTGLHLLTGNAGSDQSTVDDGVSSHVDEDKRAKNELAQLKIELEQMNNENQRLRGMLTQVTNNYSALLTLMQQTPTNGNHTTQEHQINVEGKLEDQKKEEEVRGEVIPIRQFIQLGPGGTVVADEQQSHSHSSSEEITLSGSPGSTRNPIVRSDGKRSGRKEDSPESEEAWVPNKVPKLNIATSSNSNTVDQPTEVTMRKARVSVRARSEAPMIADGCQWRKYGQKMAKGNPCPRAYYRCTMAVGCPVRKQVQRCAEDTTILITTYEGNHNHPLPPAAITMASTTSAAANMMLSGSMASTDGMMNSNLLARAILPYSSNMATISASAPFPTVTLDLTHSPNPLQYQRPSSQFSAPTQNFPLPPTPPPQPQAFGQTLYNRSKFSGLHFSHEMESNQLHHQAQPPQTSFPDPLSAATAAITADPNFTAALAAAISSIIGGGSHQNNNNNNSPATNSSSHKTSSFSGN